MKKYLILYQLFFLSLHGIAQLTIGSGVQWVNNGNTSVVLQDLNLVNDGSISAGAGSFKFTGTEISTISGTSMPVFNMMEIGKTNAKVLLNRNISVGASINFISGQLDLNGNNILLGSSAYIAGESETNRIIGPGGGFVEITQDMNSPNSTNAGNLGAFITSSANLGSVTIRRGHTPQSGTGLTGSIQRYFSIVPANNSNLNATLRLKYFDAELNGQNENILVMYQSNDNGANWNNLSKTSSSTNSNYIEKTGLGSLTLQTLENDVISGPVGGLTFTGARKKSTEVQLNWTSQTEINMSGYQVQRRLDNEADFTDKAFVSSLAPGGNSNSPLSYQNIDANAYTGTSYYRLKIIDLASNISYSNIISVAGKTKGGGGKNGGGKNLTIATTTEEIVTAKLTNEITSAPKAKINVGPNPNNGNFWFTINGIDKETDVMLYTIDGKLVKQFKTVNLKQQPVNGLRSGIYLLKVQGMDAVKIIVQGGSNNSSGNTITETLNIKN